MENLLLIGGAGFTGRHIIDAWLRSASHQVTVLDSGVSHAGMTRMTDLAASGRITLIQDDARDRGRLEELFTTDTYSQVVELCTGIQRGPAEVARREALDSMARGTQYLVECMAEYATGIRLTQLVSTAPWGDQPDRAVKHGVSVRPASLMGVAESIAMEVGLGLGRELDVPCQVMVAPLAFGAHQIQGPLAEFIMSILEGDGHPVSSQKLDWRLIYGPDLAERLTHALIHPPVGDVIRLPGLQGIQWGALTQTIAELLQRFSLANPALKARFPNADWVWRGSLQETCHPGWPEVVLGGAGAIELPETPWPTALADTLRWYLSNSEQWRPKRQRIQEQTQIFAPAM